ncbi:MAG: alpha/beta fold hydrolase [Promethearchaeota archaeon]
MRLEFNKLDTEILETLGLHYLELSNGFVHYQFAEKNSGPIILLIHGFSVASFIWDPTYKFLEDLGYRVLRYDLFGRGFSDRPKVRYCEEMYYQQLNELVQQLNLKDESLSLIGQSMGGIIAVQYYLKHFDRIERLVLISPAGLPIEKSSYPWILKIPFINKLIFKNIGLRRVISETPQAFHNPSHFPHYEELFKEQIKYKGYANALLSTLLHMPLQSMTSVYQQLALHKLSLLLIWGENDQNIPCTHAEKFKQLIPHLKYHKIPSSGHFPHYEQPDQVHPILETFLSEKTTLEP